VFTDAGDKPNIVPEHAAAQWYVRSTNRETLEPLKDRVMACLESGAAAAGCSMTHHWNDPPFADMVDNRPLLDLFCANAAEIGRVVTEPDEQTMVAGSTDMGNVSYAVPAIHPMIKVAPPGTSIHTPEFAHHARSEAGDRAVIDGALAMACTIVDLWADGEALGAVRGAFPATT
jgi:metal-dependent amidase/aminoacylase/carboxypeptidase family protein